MCRPGVRPVHLIGIWPEVGEANHICRKNFSLESLTKDFISDFRKFLITSQNSRKFMFLKFWPASGQNSIKITAALEAI